MIRMTDRITLGNVAYIAYGQQVEFKSWNGQSMPLWGELSDKIRNAWEKAAIAAIEWHNDGVTTLTKP